MGVTPHRVFFLFRGVIMNDPPAPSPQEIQKAYLAIQSNWNAKQEERRRVSRREQLGATYLQQIEVPTEVEEVDI